LKISVCLDEYDYKYCNPTTQFLYNGFGSGCDLFSNEANTVSATITTTNSRSTHSNDTSTSDSFHSAPVQQQQKCCVTVLGGRGKVVLVKTGQTHAARSGTSRSRSRMKVGDCIACSPQSTFIPFTPAAVEAVAEQFITTEIMLQMIYNSNTCKHHFHMGCISNWLQLHSNIDCPCCRTPLVVEDEVWEIVKEIRKQKKKKR
jgi:Ring finger domain